MLVVVAVGACSHDGGSSGSVLDESLLPGPGTELDTSFTVPEATRLVGPVPTDEDWYVELVLDGDPRDAADDLVRQAIAADIRLEAHCGVQPQRTRCVVRGLRHDGDSVLEEVYLQLEQSSGGDRYRSGGTLLHNSWAPGENAVGRGVEGLVDDPGPLPRPDLPPPDSPPALPDVGDPIADEALQAGAEIVVAEGSEVVVPPAPSGCVTGGFDARLIITGDLDAVVDDYEAQFDDWDEDSGVTRTRSGSDIRLQAGSMGGGDLSLEVVRGDPVWATLSRCND